MTKRNLVLVVMALAACEEPIAEDAIGELGPMVFETADDDCRPNRFTGSTGSLFVDTTVRPTVLSHGLRPGGGIGRRARFRV